MKTARKANNIATKIPFEKLIDWESNMRKIIVSIISCIILFFPEVVFSFERILYIESVRELKELEFNNPLDTLTLHMYNFTFDSVPTKALKWNIKKINLDQVYGNGINELLLNINNKNCLTDLAISNSGLNNILGILKDNYKHIKRLEFNRVNIDSLEFLNFLQDLEILKISNCNVIFDSVKINNRLKDIKFDNIAFLNLTCLTPTKSIKNLILSRLQFIVNIDSICNFDNLNLLFMDDLSINTDFSFLSKMSNLQYVSINKISDVDVNKLINNLKLNKNLELLDLVENNIRIIPHDLFNYRHLKCLALQGNHIIKIPEQIENLTELTELWLDDNDIESFPANISKLTSLETLSARYNNIRDVSALNKSMASLRSLQLDGKPISDKEISIIKVMNPKIYISK